jgi:hypothetical protein
MTAVSARFIPNVVIMSVKKVPNEYEKPIPKHVIKQQLMITNTFCKGLLIKEIILLIRHIKFVTIIHFNSQIGKYMLNDKDHLV